MVAPVGGSSCSLSCGGVPTVGSSGCFICSSSVLGPHVPGARLSLRSRGPHLFGIVSHQALNVHAFMVLSACFVLCHQAHGFWGSHRVLDIVPGL